MSGKPLKVLSLVYENLRSIRGGMGVWCQEIGQRARDYGAEMTFLSLDTDQVGGPKHHSAYRNFEVHNLNDHYMKFGAYHDMITLENYLGTYLKYLSHELFDVIHINDSYLYNVAKVIQFYQPAPMVITSHLSPWALYQDRDDNEHRYRVEKELLAYSHCQKIIAVSEYYRKLIKDWFLIRTPCEVIHNGVSADDLPQKSKLAEQINKVGFIGRCVPMKGIEDILRLSQELPHIEFHIWSNFEINTEKDFDLTQRLKKASQDQSNLKLYNPHNPKTKWEKCIEMDLAIMPSHHEPFGIVALEWMAMGVPLVVYEEGGLAEFCTDANSYLCRKPNRYESMKRFIEGYKKEEASAKQREGFVTANKWNWNQSAERFYSKLRKTYEHYDQNIAA